MVFILGVSYIKSNAQWSFDVPSIEAYIADHKNERSLLSTRSTLEQSNALLHSYSKESTLDYRDINVDLDRYSRAFDIIDIMYQSLRMSLNVYDTYDTFRNRVEDYRQMLDMFHRKCLQKMDIVSTDTVLISINRLMIENIADDAGNIYKSFSDLLLYVTGAASCSTSDLLLIISDINNSLSDIQREINVAYFECWRYIQVRIGYWKAQVYRAKSLSEIADDAFSRWRQSGRLEY